MHTVIIHHYVRTFKTGNVSDKVGSFTIYDQMNQIIHYIYDQIRFRYVRLISIFVARTPTNLRNFRENIYVSR